jgi:hypothetical protein
MAGKTVVVLGAGATKACGGPLTDEILPWALGASPVGAVWDREDLLQLMQEFVGEFFRLPMPLDPAALAHLPNLPLLLSLVDEAVDRHQQLGRWDDRDLVKVRGAIEYGVFAVIEAALRSLSANPHEELLRPLFERGDDPTVISLNYDIIVDNTMMALAFEEDRPSVPDYGCDLTLPTLPFEPGRRGRLLKVHGSLNWLYCPACHRLELFLSKSSQQLGMKIRTAKALDELYHRTYRDDAYSCQGTPCRQPGCHGHVRPILITPTHRKDYRNPHVSRIWYEAERSLRTAERVVIVGYSLPWDDVEVVYLLKRGVEHLDPRQITVVEWSTPPGMPIEQHPAGRRYRAVFGDVDWQPLGFEGWLATGPAI